MARRPGDAGHLRHHPGAGRRRRPVQPRAGGARRLQRCRPGAHRPGAAAAWSPSTRCSPASASSCCSSPACRPSMRSAWRCRRSRPAASCRSTATCRSTAARRGGRRRRVHGHRRDQHRLPPHACSKAAGRLLVDHRETWWVVGAMAVGRRRSTPGPSTAGENLLGGAGGGAVQQHLADQHHRLRDARRRPFGDPRHAGAVPGARRRRGAVDRRRPQVLPHRRHDGSVDARAEAAALSAQRALDALRQPALRPRPDEGDLGQSGGWRWSIVMVAALALAISLPAFDAAMVAAVAAFSNIGPLYSHGMADRRRTGRPMPISASSPSSP